MFILVGNDGAMQVVGWSVDLGGSKAMYLKEGTISKGKLLKDMKEGKDLTFFMEDTEESRIYSGLLSAIT